VTSSKNFKKHTMIMRGRSREWKGFETPAGRQRNNGLPAFLVWCLSLGGKFG
jgi:hypothetical protein